MELSNQLDYTVELTYIPYLHLPLPVRNATSYLAQCKQHYLLSLCCDLVNPLPRHHKLHVISIDNSENIRMLNQPSNHVYTQHAVALSQIRMIYRRPLTRRLNDRNRDHAPLMPSHSRPVYIPR